MQNWKPYKALALILLLTGCSRAPFFTLETGTVWTYSVQAGLIKKILDVRVTGKTFTNNVQASVLKSSMGNSVLYWDGPRLMASELAGTRFSPPIILLKTDDKKAVVSWKGSISSLPFTGPAFAELTQKETTVDSKSNSKSEGIETVLNLKYGTDELEIRTVYVKGIGMFQQEQRLNGRFASSLDHVSGP